VVIRAMAGMHLGFEDELAYWNAQQCAVLFLPPIALGLCPRFCIMAMDMPQEFYVKQQIAGFVDDKARGW